MTLTLQGLAGGRFMLGVGSGWLEEEFAALGVPFDERGRAVRRVARRAPGGVVGRRARRRTDRTTRSTACSLTGRRSTSRSILGGNTDRALRRAARLADGWFSSGNPTFDEAVRLRARLARARATRSGGSDRCRSTCAWPGAIRTSWPATPTTASST